MRGVSNAHPERGAFLTGRLTNTAELEGSSPVVAQFTVNELRFVCVCLDSALYLRSVYPIQVVFHGLRCHPPTSMLLEIRLTDDSSFTAYMYELGSASVKRIWCQDL
jgi:hypothetical protein